MSVQTKIIAEIQELVMKILKNGSVTEEEGIAIDSLEEELHKQNAFKKGEEVATLFFNKKTQEGIDKLVEYKITPEDFFSFIEYHYDEEHPDEALIVMFTSAFIAEVNGKYRLKFSE